MLHESAVAPVRERQIPLHIRSTFAPDAPGTRIGFDAPASLSASGVIGFAGRRPVSMLRVIFPENTEETALWEVRACLNEHRIETFHSACGVEGLCLLLSSGTESDALHAAAEQLRERFPGAKVKLRENFSRPSRTLPVDKRYSEALRRHRGLRCTGTPSCPNPAGRNVLRQRQPI